MCVLENRTAVLLISESENVEKHFCKRNAINGRQYNKKKKFQPLL
jgi:hypothetical protein